MTTLQLSEIKKAGLKMHLLRQSSTKLFTARSHLEDAEKELFANFTREIKKAREAIEDAEQLWSETYNL